ncbi:hypothetical protein FNF31_01782 [Cafeteria roenbergensis]|uniref:DOT1 domain-containing protein n=1 Tax=Cafeteria roenbergensis TaxID=33653 RepID=A0A5A8DK34_CAFRO|nr:hypothetical protein FNF31_01782 [Cafeteria roenbergensis]
MAEPATPSEAGEPEPAEDAPPCPEKRWGKIHPDLWPEDLHASLRLTGIDNVAHRLVPERSLPGATSERVRSAYADIKRVSGHVGGEAHGGAVYGEMGRANMQRLIELMVRVTDLNADSVFLDIGSGLGKPSIHAAAAVGCFSLGVEYMATRFNLSVANLKRLCRPADGPRAQGPLRELGEPRVMFCCEDAWLMGSLEPTTHLFMFDVGMPPPLMRHVAATFMASSSTDYLVCYRPPAAAEELGFDVSLLASLTCRLIGSAEAHRAFVYRKRAAVPGRGQASALGLVQRMRAAAAEGVVSGALDDLEPAYEAAMARVRGEEPEDGAGKVGTTANGGRVGCLTSWPAAGRGTTPHWTRT